MCQKLRQKDKMRNNGKLNECKTKEQIVFLWTRVFQRASPLNGRDSLFIVLLLENHLKRNGLESPLIFVLF